MFLRVDLQKVVTFCFFVTSIFHTAYTVSLDDLNSCCNTMLSNRLKSLSTKYSAMHSSLFAILDEAYGAEFLISTTQLNTGQPLNLELPGIYKLVGSDVLITNATSSGVLINVLSDGITLDLNGRTIDANDLIGTVISASGHSNLIVKGGIIKSSLGPTITITDTYNVQLTDLSILSSGDDGITVSGSTFVILRSNVVMDTIGKGYVLDFSSQVWIQDCIAVENAIPPAQSQAGYAITNSHNIFFNEVKSLGYFNGYLFRSSNTLICDKCLALNNNSNGFMYEGGTAAYGIILNDTIAMNNGGTGFFIDGVNSILNAVIAVSNNIGIAFGAQAVRGLIDASSAMSNTQEGLLINSGAHDIEAKNSTFLYNGTNIVNNSTPSSPLTVHNGV